MEMDMAVLQTLGGKKAALFLSGQCLVYSCCSISGCSNFNNFKHFLYLTATAFKSECIKIIQPWNIVKATNGIEWVNKQKNDIKGIQKRMPT